MRTILVNLEVSPVLDSALQCALLVAQRFGSYIEGLHMRPGPARHHRRRRRRLRRRRPRPGRQLRARGARAGRAGAHHLRGVHGAARPAARRRPAARQRRLRRLADRGHQRPWRDRQPRPRVRPRGDGPARRRFGGAQHGRAGDRAVRERPAAADRAADSARGHGRAHPVAWNCSTETARTVGFAMPLLALAQRITVLTVQRGTVPGPSAAELARNLQRHGLSVEWREVAPGDHSTGEAILREAAQLRRGPDHQGRLHPEPPAPDDLRRGHQPHPGRGRAAGRDGELIAARAPPCPSAPPCMRWPPPSGSAACSLAHLILRPSVAELASADRQRLWDRVLGPASFRSSWAASPCCC